MKRNLETIRNILLRLESYNDKELTDKEIIYHLDMLINTKYVETTTVLKDGGSFYYQDLKLTWEGHELLASISNKQVWESIKNTLHENNFSVDDVPIEVVKTLSQKILKEMFGGKIGGEDMF